MPIISAMGAGGKLYTNFVIGDIFSTKGCPLARAVRGGLRKAGITALTAVYSEEAAVSYDDREKAFGKNSPASISYVPGVCGLTAAGEIIRRLSGVRT